MKEKILELIHNPHYRPLNLQGFYTALNAEGTKDEMDIISALNSLEDEYIIIRNKKNKYLLLNDAGFYIGKINIKAKGFGFISSESLTADVYVAKEDTNDSLNNDIVLFKVTRASNKELRDTAKVIKVIERDLKYIVGEVYKRQDNYYLKSDDYNSKMLIEIANLNGAIPEHKVKTEIVNIVDSRFATVNVIDIIGHKNDVGIDIASVASKYNFVQEFPEEVLEQVKNYSSNVSHELSNRRDLTDKIIITIDGEDAKDLDDAVRVEILPNGNYLLGVYIADVSYYVPENSPLDISAYQRSTSCYLADRVIPMLPHRLSNDLCSLNPGQDRLVVACEMEIDKNGQVINSEIFEGYINTYARMTYTEVNKVLEGCPEAIVRNSGLVDLFKLMNDLSLILLGMRIKRGALEFEIPESQIIVNEKGEVTNIVLRERKRAERIIEEFMLIANETVAQTIFWLELPFLYRVHDEPNEEKLKKFLLIAKNLGYQVNAKGKKVNQKDLQNLLEEITDEDRGLNTVLLRMMAKAKYSEKNIGHYGLASQCYTHFTAPIRRYSDLVVHRLLRKYLFNHDINKEKIDELNQKVVSAAIQSSERERSAIDCENEVSDMKKAEYMAQFVGQVFEGVISSVTNFGMFIALPNTVEGLVHVLDMKDDYYEYYEDMMMLMGRVSKKKYRIGDTVKVKLTSAIKELREINFELVYNKPIRSIKKNNGRWENAKHRKKNYRKK